MLNLTESINNSILEEIKLDYIATKIYEPFKEYLEIERPKRQSELQSDFDQRLHDFFYYTIDKEMTSSLVHTFFTNKDIERLIRIFQNTYVYNRQSLQFVLQNLGCNTGLRANGNLFVNYKNTHFELPTYFFQTQHHTVRFPTSYPGAVKSPSPLSPI